MRKTRILFPFAGDTVLGGSHISAMALIKSLDRNRFEPQILIHFEPGPVGEYAASLGLDYEITSKVSLLGTPNSPGTNDVGLPSFLFSSLPKIIGLIKRFQPDIVHTNEGRIHANWTIPVWMSGRKHLWHHRQDPAAFGINTLAPVFADFIASVSEFSKPSKPVLSVDRKFQVVRSPFDFLSPRPNKAEARKLICDELNLPKNVVLLGYFGLLNARKRPLHFVEAVANIQKKVPERPVHGLIFGAEESEAGKFGQGCQEKAKDLGIASQIHIMGFRKPISGFMAGVDVKLVTALSEPFGRTLIEAMYLGTPVVATKHGGNPEAITNNETGFLVEHESPKAFVEPVVNLINDSDLYQRISASARKHATSNFGIDLHVKLISEIYDQLARPEN